VGVEPTKDRLAASPGFEVRTPHQGRFPSINRQSLRLVHRRAKKVKSMVVNTAQIATPQRHSMTIKEFKNLNGNRELDDGAKKAERLASQPPQPTNAFSRKSKTTTFCRAICDVLKFRPHP
jgi:hypothetical protein